jgi:hypothetical protein
LHGETETLHSFFSFPTGDARVDEHGFMVIAYIIAIAIAARIERSDE